MNFPSSLRQQRCRNHAEREAAARCPSCGCFFCRECVTEHAGRILCAPCLARLAQPAAGPKRRRFPLRATAAALAGFAALWITFYTAGRLLLALPSDFHEGAMWEKAIDGEN